VLALKAWFQQQLARVLAKATIAENIRHAQNQRDGFTRFLDDGRIKLDTNIVERSIRVLIRRRGGLCWPLPPRLFGCRLRRSVGRDRR